MPRFRKKPVVIDAIRYDGPAFITVRNGEDCWYASEFDAVRRFIGRFFSAVHVGSVTHGGPEQYAPAVRSLEGLMRVSPGDWIIRGVQGEFYPCKPDIFDATYEAAEDEYGNETPQVIR